MTKLTKITIFTTIVWILIQIVIIVLYWDFEQTADAWHYMEEAFTHYQTGELYPSRMDLYDDFIQSPGMCNYLLLIYAVFGHFKVDIIINLLMNIAVLGEIFYLGKKLFSYRTACISVILYCLIFTNSFVSLYILTEVPFLFFSLSAFVLSLSDKYKFVFIASILYVIAYMLRPTVLAFCFASVIYHLLSHTNWKYILVGITPFALCVFGIGMYNKSQTGYFITSSSTGGQNLLMSIDKDAHLGGANSVILTDSTRATFIYNKEYKTFYEKDSIYRSMAIPMIKENPSRYIYNCIRKIPMMFLYDEWSFPDKWYYFEKEVDSLEHVWKVRLSLLILSFTYLMICLLFFVSLWINKRDLRSSKIVIPLLVFTYVFGSCLLTIENRYHYPFVFALSIWAAYGIDQISSKNENFREASR